MCHTLYAFLVLTSNPTIPADLNALADGRYSIREEATTRLESLPGWTALFFQHYSAKAETLEARFRSERVYRKLDLKWKADFILALYPSIPADIKKAAQHQSYKVRESSIKRLQDLPGITALYFKYYASVTKDKMERDKCDKLHQMLDQKWNAKWGGLCAGFQWDVGVARERRKFEKYLAAAVVNLSKLSAEDLKLVEAQTYCPIQEGILGGNGVPVKITLKGQVVFLCCKDCIATANADPDKTLAKVEDVKKWGRLTLKQLKEKVKQMSDSSGDDK